MDDRPGHVHHQRRRARRRQPARAVSEVYYDVDEDAATGRQLYTAKLIPNRGAWLEFETSNRSVLSVKVDRKRKIPVTTLLRAVGLVDSQEMLKTFAPVDDNPEHPYIALTLEKDPTTTQEEALVEVYKKLRPGDPPTVERADARQQPVLQLPPLRPRPCRSLQAEQGPGEMASKLQLELPTEEPDTPRESRVISQADIVAIVAKLIELNNGRGEPDDIDHLGNRRIGPTAELIQNQFRIGLLRMERVVKERMTITDPEQATPNSLINIRPVVAAMKEFFGGSQLSQFMDQTNPWPS